MGGLRVAVLGAGDMAGHHVQAWQDLGHEVASVTDMDTERAGALAERHAVPRTFADYRDAVVDPQIDAVSICLPLALHAPATILAAAHGKHVMCEKPLSRSVAEAREMEAAVRAAGVHFAVGFQRNLAEGVGILRDLAAAGRFGRPMVFSSDLLQEVRPKAGMHDREGNNGPLTDAGCHYYLLWQTVFRSKPKRVYAQGRIAATGRPELSGVRQLAVDTAVVTAEFESGDIGTFTVSWGLAAGFRMTSRPDRIIGPDGGAEGAVNSQLTVYSGDRTEEIDIETKDLWIVEIEQFAAAVQNGGRPPAGFREGRQM
ncbi:MAG TPA: Gfo/Idh/MocA family oxidoreductase, partial [Mycobacteriales bacterium]|nr:Gfo/Idh/MocA family oxidoreductase [Mycobacteriales bacterium]